jgi:hypothetical protein
MCTTFSDACIRSFLMLQHSEEFCVTETVHQTRYCGFLWYSRIGKCILKTRSGRLSES